MDESVLEAKPSFKMLGLNFSSKLDWGSYIISFAKSVSLKIEGLIFSMTFLCPEVALYLYISTMHLCVEYWCHIWAYTRRFYLELLDKLQNRYVGLLVLHLFPLLGPWLISEMQPA